MTRRPRPIVGGFLLILFSLACQTVPSRSLNELKRLKIPADVEFERIVPLLHAEQSERYPYIQNVTPTSAVIAWRTHRQGEAVVFYGEAKGEEVRAVASKGPSGDYVFLTNLKPHTRYFSKVMIDGHLFGRGISFKTANGAEDTRFSFVVFGDSGSGGVAQWKMARIMKRLTFNLAIITGDIVYPRGRDEDFDSRYFKPYAKLIGHIPFYPALGNHDIKTDGGRPFRENFYLPGNEEYYDFSYGHAQFIALNSNRVMWGDEQTRWLERILKESNARWKIVYFHHPAFSSGPHGSHKMIQEIWVPIFVRYGVDIVFSGHDHTYERTHPINGVVYVVTGGGGSSLYDVGQSPFTACSRKAYHLVYVSVKGDEMSFQAIGEDGRVLDSYAFVKGAAKRSPDGCRGGSPHGDANSGL